jgi:hypothetical protein
MTALLVLTSQGMCDVRDPARVRAYTGLARGTPEGWHADAVNDAPWIPTLRPRYLGIMRLGSQPSRQLEVAARWRTRIESAL